MSDSQPLLTLSPGVATELVEKTRRELPRQAQVILRNFWLEKMRERGLIPTTRQRIMAFTSAGAIHNSQVMRARYASARD